MLEMFQNQTMRYISIAIGVISIFIFLYLLKLGEGLVISLMVAVFICGLSLFKLKNYYEKITHTSMQNTLLGCMVNCKNMTRIYSQLSAI